MIILVHDYYYHTFKKKLVDICIIFHKLLIHIVFIYAHTEKYKIVGQKSTIFEKYRDYGDVVIARATPQKLSVRSNFFSG